MINLTIPKITSIISKNIILACKEVLVENKLKNKSKKN